MIEYIKKHFFYKQHPETALRYLPIIDTLKINDLLNAKILEVGSGAYGIAAYLKGDLTGVDTYFEDKIYPGFKVVKSKGQKLPFDDNTFDVVILSDVLEHIPNTAREKVIDECLRVAKKAIVISGPFDNESAKQDAELAKYSLEKTGKVHHFFNEHLKFGLPDSKEMVELLNKKQKVSSAKIVKKTLSLWLRKVLMLIFIQDNFLAKIFYMKGLMLFVPIFRIINWGECYRKILWIELKILK